MRIALASKSVIRRQLLENAGVPFSVCDTSGDENAAIAAALQEQLSDRDIAIAAASSKALGAVAEPRTSVIGADQILVFDGQLLRKVETIEDARARLQQLRARSHTLVSAVAIAIDQRVAFTCAVACTIWMRDFSDRALDEYLEDMGERLLFSVSCYLIEGPGIQLLSRIEGDYFTALGLPLLETLEGLRSLGDIER